MNMGGRDIRSHCVARIIGRGGVVDTGADFKKALALKAADRRGRFLNAIFPLDRDRLG